MSLIDTLCVIGLLSGVPTIGAFIRDWNDNLGRVRVPVMVQLSRRIAGDVATGISPRQAGPSGARAPKFTVVSPILRQVDCAVVVNNLGELSNTTGVISWGQA